MDSLIFNWRPPLSQPFVALTRQASYIMGKVAEFAKETKSFPPPAEGYNLKEKNVNPDLRIGKPVTPVDMTPETNPQPIMMMVRNHEDILVQKKPVQFIDFLGVGTVE